MLNVKLIALHEELLTLNVLSSSVLARMGMLVAPMLFGPSCSG